MGKRIILLVGFLASSIWAVLLFPSVEAIAASPQSTLKHAIHWSVVADWLDPSTNIALNTTSFPLYLFHDGLVKTMPEGVYTPSLAESWTVSPDFKVYEFKLRRGVRFHNGEPMTAEDVIFSYWRYKVGPVKLIHGKTEKIEAVNPHLVRIAFKGPFPDFLDYLIMSGSAIGWVVPKKYVEKVGDAAFRKHPVGCGPYKFVEFVPGVKLVAEAFEDYWRKVPPIKRMEFYTVFESATRLAMVRRGEADIATLLTGVFYEDVKKDPNLRLLSPMSPTRWLVYPASQWDPQSPWSDPRVRKAASLAIDRKTLADVFSPGCDGIGSLSLPDDPNGVDYPKDPYDPALAKKLLAETGYPKGFAGGRFYPYGGYWEYGEQIATYWKAVGINVENALLDRPAYLSMRQGGKMKGAIFIDWAVAPNIAMDLSYLFGPASYGNYPDIQKSWDQYGTAASQGERKGLVVQIQKMIHERTMFIPLTSTNSPAAVGPRVKGNPWKIQPPKTFPVWFASPFEDMELVN